MNKRSTRWLRHAALGVAGLTSLLFAAPAAADVSIYFGAPYLVAPYWGFYVGPRYYPPPRYYRYRPYRNYGYNRYRYGHRPQHGRGHQQQRFGPGRGHARGGPRSYKREGYGRGGRGGGGRRR